MRLPSNVDCTLTVFFLLVSLLPLRLSAEVTAAGDGGFVSEHELVLVADPHRVYEALTAEVGNWWDPNHSISGSAAGFSLDARAGGLQPLAEPVDRVQLGQLRRLAAYLERTADDG